jgi:hypothetical protein
MSLFLPWLAPLLAGLTTAAMAHPGGVASLELQVRETGIEGRFTHPPANEAIPSSPVEDFQIGTDTGPCAGTVVERRVTEGLVETRLRWTCPDVPRALRVEDRSRPTGSAEHITFLRVSSDTQRAVQQGIVGASAPRVRFELQSSPPWIGVAADYVRIGVEHLVGGLDHVLFVISLLLPGISIRSALAVVTAFTLAHSVTLGASSLNLLSSIPSRPVEVAIALSIAAIAVRNHTTPNPNPGKVSLVVVAVFGLVHGLGFAGALSEIGLPDDRRLLALGFFNLGLELAQVAVVAIAWPVVRAARARPIGRALIQAANLSILATALAWAVQRMME